MKRILVVVAVAAMLVLAGCAGGNGVGDDADPDTDAPDEPTAEDESNDDDETDTADNDVDDTDTGSPDDNDSVDGEQTPPTTDVNSELEVHHIDVGQADSTLVLTPDDETILIDTGDWRQDGSDVITYLESEGIDRVDHLVATHGHADHIGGHAAVIEHFEENGDGIGAIYDSGVPHDSQTYENYLDTVDEYDHELLIVEAGDELPVNDESVDALVVNPPAGDSGDDLHYNSVSLLLEFGEQSYVTTGDAEDDAEERMADNHGNNLDATVYQAGHHGSSTSSTQPFMDVVDPEIAVVSSAYDSQYDHPNAEVLQRFSDMDIETYWTAVHGDIVVTMDGESVDIDTSDTFSTDPEDLLEERPDDDDASASITAAAPAVEGAAAPTPG